VAESEPTRTQRPDIGQFSASQDRAESDGSCACDGTDQSASSPQHVYRKAQARHFLSAQNGSGGAVASSIARIRAIVSSRRSSSAGENSTLCREPPPRTTIP
jgi:hypothetical protein